MTAFSDREHKSAAIEAKRLIEAAYDKRVRALRRIATRRDEWVSPFFWQVLYYDGSHGIVAMRYSDKGDTWYVEQGTDYGQEFEET